MTARRLTTSWPHGILPVFAWLGLSVIPGTCRGDEIDALTQQLAASNAYQRMAAADKVAELGPAAAKAVPALIEALKCERLDVLFEDPRIAASRQKLADALARVGSNAAPDLEKSLAQDNGLVRVWSAYALYRIDRERYRDQAIAVVTAGLRQGNEIAADAGLVLEQIGADATPAIPALLKQLEHPDLAVRCNAATALAAIAQPDKDDPLVAALRGKSSLVRVGAAFALARMQGNLSADFQAAIAAALEDPSADARRQAVWAIGQLGTLAQPLASNLIRALPKLEPDPFDHFFGGGPLRKHATDPALVLVATGPDCKPELIKAMASDDSRQRVMAAVALVRLDREQTERVAPILQAARNDPDPSLKFVAEMLAAQMAPPATKDLAGLIDAALTGNGFGPPSPAVMQLIQRGPEAVGPLLDVLKRGDGQAAGSAVRILSGIGPPALPALTEALQSDNAQLRVFAVRALAGMGKPAVPALEKALDDDLYPVRRTAHFALRALRTPATAVPPKPEHNP